MDTMFVSFPIQQSTNCKFCLNEVTQKENKEQKHAHNRHILDKYNTKQEIEIRRLKNEKKKKIETDHGPIRQFHDRSWTDFEGSVQAQCSTVM